MRRSASNASECELAGARQIASIANMSGKKHTTIGVRVDDDLLSAIKRLAKKEERPLAAMARLLIAEALRKRGSFK